MAFEWALKETDFTQDRRQIVMLHFLFVILSFILNIRLKFERTCMRVSISLSFFQNWFRLKEARAGILTVQSFLLIICNFCKSIINFWKLSRNSCLIGNVNASACSVTNNVVARWLLKSVLGSPPLSRTMVHVC